MNSKRHKNTPEVSHFDSFVIDCILFPIQSLTTRLNSQRLSVVTRAWAAYAVITNIDVDKSTDNAEPLSIC